MISTPRLKTRQTESPYQNLSSTSTKRPPGEASKLDHHRQDLLDSVLVKQTDPTTKEATVVGSEDDWYLLGAISAGGLDCVPFQ